MAVAVSCSIRQFKTLASSTPRSSKEALCDDDMSNCLSVCLSVADRACKCNY